KSSVLQRGSCDPSWWKGAPDSLPSPKPRTKVRGDGWTTERQLRFLDTLSGNRNVTKAAASVGMSRESAYRLRSRREGALFAAAWDRTMAGRPGPHTAAGRLAGKGHANLTFD